MGKEWLDDAIFYEIYPQSFQDTNSDGIGDFRGILRRLDYIRDLGCSAIWMNPCFDSPFTDAGYDVADYFKAAPRYGTNEDLAELFREVHRRGMHILLDLVPGHTSIQCRWFRESMKPEKNEFSGRYIWTDSVWTSVEGIKNLTGCIRGLSDRNGSCATNFFSTQPALNYGFAEPKASWQNPVDHPDCIASRRAMEEVMDFWLTLGCDGFRVDMAGAMIKNDPDGEATVRFWQTVREELGKKHPDCVLISEWGEPDKALRAGYDMDFLLHFGPSHYNDLFRCEHPWFGADGLGDASAFVSAYRETRSRAGESGLICIPSGNHDMDRLARRLDDRGRKLAFAFLLSMPGAPFIYYGDEIGMNYVEGLPSKEGGFERTGSRSPMQWDRGVNAGFSSAAPDLLYIPLDPDPDRPNVAEQQGREGSLLEEVRRLIALRRSLPQLRPRGGVEFLYAEKDACPLVYRREDILVVLNPSPRAVSCALPGAPDAGETLYALGGEVSCRAGTVTAAPRSGAWLKLKG